MGLIDNFTSAVSRSKEVGRDIKNALKQMKDRVRQNPELNFVNRMVNNLQQAVIKKYGKETYIQYKDIIEKEIRSAALGQTNEGRKLNQLSSKTINSAGKKPGAIGYIKNQLNKFFKYLGLDKNPKQKAGLMAMVMSFLPAKSPIRGLISYFTGVKSKPKTAPKKAANPQKKKETTSNQNQEKLNPEQKNLVDLFKNKGLKLDRKNLKKDLNFLSYQNIKISQIKDILSDLLKPKALFSKLKVSLKKALGNENFEFRLSDLMLKNLKANQISQLIQIIDKKGGKKSPLNNQVKIRAFLNNVRIDFNRAVKPFKKILKK